MNIKITYNWLREYLETDATPYELQEYLSLAGPSFEKVEKVGDDYVFDIEVTSNRIDMASVFGIAQEATAILPQYGKQAQLRLNPLETYRLPLVSKTTTGTKETLPLTIDIRNPDLCSRFTAVVLDNVAMQKAPKYITERLEMCDINSINAIVDISNYIMLSLGQPTHMFDYDRIEGATMVLRESREGEIIKTLDEREFELPGGDIVIEDGAGRLIDMCGIMGGFNSAITPNTRRIVYFVQTYDKRRIRKTSMTTGQRSDAAGYFEKGLDPERVSAAVGYGVELISSLTGGTPASVVYDIYPKPYSGKTVDITMDRITRKIGVAIPQKTATRILTCLGFEVDTKQSIITVHVPSYRANDVSYAEDIIEEIARVYGYHNIPSVAPAVYHVEQPAHIKLTLDTIKKMRKLLSYSGLHEILHYSMTSQKVLNAFEIDPGTHLAIQNSISEDIVYMRRSLVPSLIETIAANQGRRDNLDFFEIAKTYTPVKKSLPDERYKLAVAVRGDYFSVKGVLEKIIATFHIPGISYQRGDTPFYYAGINADIMIDGTPIGHMGTIKRRYRDELALNDDVSSFEIDLESLGAKIQTVTRYQPPQQYAVIRLSQTLQPDADMMYQDIVTQAQSVSSLLIGCEYGSTEKNRGSDNTMVVRFLFAAEDRNLTEDEAKTELMRVISLLPVSIPNGTQ